MPTRIFEGSQGTCSWTGDTWSDNEMVAMSDDVRERVFDVAWENEVVDKLSDLASTQVSSKWLTKFFEKAASDEVLPWKVGEAIAEAVLIDSHSVVLPWNTRRDERNLRASLQGADIVGISKEAQGCRLVFGEVKSSSEQKSPPRVVTGKSGLVKQLERLIEDDNLKLAPLKWLCARVGDAAETLFDEAFAAFAKSEGKSIRLIGILVRDTPANERDVSGGGRSLGGKVHAPGTVELLAMYMPRPMAEWPRWVKE